MPTPLTDAYLLYPDLPPNLSAPAAKPRITVVRCMPCANASSFLVRAYAIDQVTAGDVFTPTVLTDTTETIGNQCGTVTVLRKTHWIDFLHQAWEQLRQSWVGPLVYASSRARPATRLRQLNQYFCWMWSSIQTNVMLPSLEHFRSFLVTEVYPNSCGGNREGEVEPRV